MIAPGRPDITSTRSAQKIASRDAVGDEQGRDALRGLHPLQQHVHLVARQRIERAERLVEKQQRRPRQQGARDGHALAHAARQLPGIGVRRRRATSNSGNNSRARGFQAGAGP